jgi:hypothetical protein
VQVKKARGTRAIRRAVGIRGNVRREGVFARPIRAFRPEKAGLAAYPL